MTDQPAKITTASSRQAEEVVSLLRARNPLIWVVTREEARVERYLIEAAAAAKYVPHTWDIAQGCKTIAGSNVSGAGDTTEPNAVFNLIRTSAEQGDQRRAWIMRDLAPWVTAPIGLMPQRGLRNLARYLPGVGRESAQVIIIMSTSASVPDELASHATVVQWPLPDRDEIGAILDGVISNLPDEYKAKAAPNGTRDAAIDAAVGLTGEEAAACYAKSLVQVERIDPAMVAAEKKRVIAREQVLEWFDPLPGGLDAVGGLDVLKRWLEQRKLAYSPAARAYGLPAPKGAMLVGVPGCGKSLTAKAIATAWGVPLLRIDLGALKSKFVGESEQNLRKAFDVIKSVGRCVVWFDEIEKALAGATQGAADGGVSSDALGAVLSWMQDRQGEAFVIATANSVKELPPELLRKGRFDEVFFIDLPTQLERIGVLAAALKSHGRKDIVVDHPAVAMACDKFTGSEIAALVPDAMFTAFADSARELTTADLMAAVATVKPLSKTAAEKITELRKWAIDEGRARLASTPEITGDKGGEARRIDF